MNVEQILIKNRVTSTEEVREMKSTVMDLSVCPSHVECCKILQTDRRKTCSELELYETIRRYWAQQENAIRQQVRNQCIPVKQLQHVLRNFQLLHALIKEIEEARGKSRISCLGGLQLDLQLSCCTLGAFLQVVKADRDLPSSAFLDFFADYQCKDLPELL